MTLVGALASVARPDGDNSTTRRATVRALDNDARRIEVQDGEATIVVPYLGFIDHYAPGDTVLLIREPTGPVALGVLGAALNVSADAAPGAGAAPTGLALDRDGSTASATWDAYGGASQYRLRASLNGGSTWAPTVTTTALTYDFGIGEGKTLTVQVAAFAGAEWTLWSSSVSVTYPLTDATTETVTVTVQPSDSATYRVGSGWDRWNATRWGGSRDVYQGNAYGSGDLIGWVGYGNRIVGLGATEITGVTLKVKRNPWTNLNTPAALQVQGSTSGSQPSGNPSSTGTGATATTPGALLSQWVSTPLPESMREALRTGSIRGLLAVGSNASGWYGASGSMALTITYVRRV